MSPRGPLAREVGAATEADGGGTRMRGGLVGDILGAPDPRRPAGAAEQDPFALRDPDYIRRTLPALRALSNVYFRGEVHGLENIPVEGPVLLVGNHSGGTIIADTFVFAQAFYDHFGAGREFHQLAHDLVFKMPGMRALVT